MKILVIGATGMIGSRITAEALSRGHQVTALTRHGSVPGGVPAIKGDAADADTVARAAAGHDAVVLSVSPPRDGSAPAPALQAIRRAVLEGLAKAGVRRLVIVGGAGSLEVAPGVRLVDTPDFPQIYKAEALAHAELLDLIRAEGGDLDWTYISPAGLIEPGERTGTFRTGGDQLLTDAEGNSFISAEDFAVGLVDELENAKALKRRITFAY